MTTISTDDLAKSEARILRAIEDAGARWSQAVAESTAQLWQAAADNDVVIRRALSGTEAALAAHEEKVLRAMRQMTWTVIGGATVIMAIATVVILGTGGAGG